MSVREVKAGLETAKQTLGEATLPTADEVVEFSAMVILESISRARTAVDTRRIALPDCRSRLTAVETASTSAWEQVDRIVGQNPNEKAEEVVLDIGSVVRNVTQATCAAEGMASSLDAMAAHLAAAYAAAGNYVTALGIMADRTQEATEHQLAAAQGINACVQQIAG